MEKFNLERALAGEPVITRDGREVTEIHFFETCTEDRSLVAVIGGEICLFHNNGLSFGTNNLTQRDLFMKPKVIEGWCNVYVSSSNEMYMSGTYPSEEKAKSCIIESSAYIKTIKVTNEK